jgi:hypothetical protein
VQTVIANSAKMIEDDKVSKETIKLKEFTNKRSSFLEYLQSQNITLYLNKSPFINKNRVVDSLIKTIRDKLSNLWLDVTDCRRL